MARDALKARQYQRAYDIVVHHGLTSGTDYVDAQFLAGWIALRFLHEPALAERHFRTLAQNVGYPISRARANYWLARANEALGKTGEAVAYYRVAAKESGTFYGQLALARIEDHPILHVADASGDDAAARAALAKDGRVYAMRVTADLGQKDLLRAFANQVARDNPDPAKLRALAALMFELGDRAGSVRIAKQASYTGAMILTYLHPVIPLARFPGAGSAPEPAMVLGLIRQETEFDPDAVSGAGARGLMQLMPASARAAASRYGLSYDLNALTSDPAYNMQLGMGEFATYLDDWNGSYILSIASYNAGENRVREWVATYGDPRSPATDPIDWIELIPFGETRNYVQRVLENTEVYRNRLAGGDKPLMILADLYRPNAPNAPVLHYSGPAVPVEGAASAPQSRPARCRNRDISPGPATKASGYRVHGHRSGRRDDAQPLARQALRLGDLVGAHFARELCPPRTRLFDPAHRRQVEPFVGGHVIDRHALPGRIGEAEIVERLGAPGARFGFELRQRVIIDASHDVLSPLGQSRLRPPLRPRGPIPPREWGHDGRPMLKDR